MKLEPYNCKDNPVIKTSLQGTNADLIAEVFKLYVPKGTVVADVTYGRGVFWRNLVPEDYTCLFSDLQSGVDFRHLPYEDNSVDVLILDPPYMHSGQGVKDSINKCYLNAAVSHESVIRLYAAGILEASRVLKPQGLILTKIQDEIESGKQRWSHIEVMELLKIMGFMHLDLFVLMQNGTPTMRELYQKTARKNHSYLIVSRFRR